MADKLTYDILIQATPSSDLTDVLGKIEFSDTSTGKSLASHDRIRFTLVAGATKSIFPVSYAGSALNFIIRPIYPNVALGVQKFQFNADAVGLVSADFLAAGLATTSLTVKNTGAVDYEFEAILFERTT